MDEDHGDLGQEEEEEEGGQGGQGSGYRVRIVESLENNFHLRSTVVFLSWPGSSISTLGVVSRCEKVIS